MAGQAAKRDPFRMLDVPDLQRTPTIESERSEAQRSSLSQKVPKRGRGETRREQWLRGSKQQQIQAERHSHRFGRLRSHWPINR